MSEMVSQITLMGFGAVMFGVAVALAVREADLLLKFSECLMKGIGVV